jgi:hypothetical protein
MKAQAFKVKVILILSLITNLNAGWSNSDQSDENECLNPEESTISQLKKIIEKKKIKKKKCEASGAWFYKIGTEKPTNHIGIEAELKLPKFTADKERHYPKPNSKNFLGAHTEGPLDRASVYLGGQIGGAELDAGLTWDKVYDEHGKDTGEFAFRPFWRSTENGPDKDTVWHNPKKTKVDISSPVISTPVGVSIPTLIPPKPSACGKEYKPEAGCSVDNVYFSNQDGKSPSISMELMIVPEKSTPLESVIKMRIREKKSSNSSGKCFEVCFIQKTKKMKPKELNNTWKRVSSIDQFGLGPCYIKKVKELKEVRIDKNVMGREEQINKKIETIKEVITSNPKGSTLSKNHSETDCRPSNEGKEVSPTNAKLENMEWEKVRLIKKDKTNKIPLEGNNIINVLGNEFCKNDSKYKGKEGKKFIDLTNGIDTNGGQSLNIIPSN